LYAKRAGYINDIAHLVPQLTAAGALHTLSCDGIQVLKLHVHAADTVIESDILSNRARGIVRFSLRGWLRDLLRPVLHRNRLSRSAMITRSDAAGTH
jgi:hypothetical protein